jgi:hypothetical protein
LSTFYLMHRGWMDDRDFDPEPYTQREAWVWLIENAAWKDTTAYVSGKVIPLRRGQLVFSQRFMAEKWKWGRQRVRTFIERLEKTEKSTQDTTQGVTILTICNYDRYQGEQPSPQPKEQPASNPPLTQQQPSDNPKKKQRNKETTYTPEFERWWALYPKKEGKGGAARAFDRALKLVDIEVLCAKAQRYDAQQRARNYEFTKNPETWLNKRCWEDEPTQVVSIRDRMPSPAGG